jgi:uncharacterized delta-60 repeat protein
VLIGGSFSTVDGIERNGIARLNFDGSPDSGFDPGAGAGGSVYSVVLQPDNKMLVGGSFSSFNGSSHRGIVRLHPNGTLDDSLDARGPWRSDFFVHAVALQPDGKILIGGNFTTATARHHIVRLHPNGTLDESFKLPIVNNIIQAIAVQRGGGILAGGSFTTVSGISRRGIVRLLGDAAVLTFGPIREGNDFTAHFKGTPGLDYTIEYCSDLAAANWQNLLNLTAPATDTGIGLGVFELRDMMVPAGARYYRAVYPAH